MASLTDPILLAAYKNALANHQWTGFVTWKEVARQWVARELDGITTREVGRMMYEFVSGGGEIDQVRETREGYEHHEFHYDLRFTISGIRVYIETCLIVENPDDPDDSVITVVNMHRA